MERPTAKIPVKREVLILPEVLVFLETKIEGFNIFDATDIIEDFYGTNYSPSLIMVSKDHKIKDKTGRDDKYVDTFNKFIDGVSQYFYENFDHNGVIEFWTDDII